MRGDGSVWLPPRSRYWWASFYVNGIRHRINTRATTREAAMDVMRVERTLMPEATGAAKIETVGIPRKSPIGTFVYLVRCVETGRYKIGYASDLRMRVRHHQTSSPTTLMLLRWRLGDHAEEQRILRESLPWEIRGEWRKRDLPWARWFPKNMAHQEKVARVIVHAEQEAA